MSCGRIPQGLQKMRGMGYQFLGCTWLAALRKVAGEGGRRRGDDNGKKFGRKIKKWEGSSMEVEGG